MELEVSSDEPIVIRYAGANAITYEPKQRVVEVEDRHVAEFLAAVPDARRIPPPVAEPAIEKEAVGGSPAREKK